MNSHWLSFLGAIKRWTDLQASGDNLIVMLADLHAVTIPREPDALRLTTKRNTLFLCGYFRKSVLETAASLIACGIDPKRSIIYRQSEVTIRDFPSNGFNTSPIPALPSYSISMVTRNDDYRSKSGPYSNL